MEAYKRIFVIVLDSLGIGAMPDANGLAIRAWIPSDISWISREHWISRT